MARNFLAMNGKKINTLDDLRSNFSGKQTLAFYRTGRLQKWLEELGESDLLEILRDFQNEDYDDETLLSMLMAAFELDEKTVSEQILMQKREIEKQAAEKSIAEKTTQRDSEVPEQTESPEIEYTPEERNVLKIRNKFLSVMRTVLADDLLDYEKHLDMSFAEFGISEDLQEKLKEKLAVEFKFYPCESKFDVYQHENGLEYVKESPFAVLCSILKKFGPECFHSCFPFNSYEYFDVDGWGHVKCPFKYRDLLLSGKKNAPAKIVSGTLDDWAAKGEDLPGNIGRFASALKPKVPEYESADVKAAAELKYFRQKAALALLEDSFKISSDPKTRNQTIILETDLKKHCGFDDKKIREFNKRLIVLFPDHEGNPTTDFLKKARGADPISALGFELIKKEMALAAAVQEAFTGSSDSLNDTFFQSDPEMRDILHATVEDIFKFCRCL